VAVKVLPLGGFAAEVVGELVRCRHESAGFPPCLQPCLLRVRAERLRKVGNGWTGLRLSGCKSLILHRILWKLRGMWGQVAQFLAERQGSTHQGLMRLAGLFSESCLQSCLQRG
jgi:hypothetical protein